MLEAIYFPKSNFLEARLGNRSSWAWSSLIQGGEILLKGTCWQIHNGRSVDFWNDKWILSSPNMKIQSPKPPWVDNLKVLDFINPHTKAWSTQKLHQVPSEEEILVVLIIPISKIDEKDSLIWTSTSNGKYSVKRGYHKAWEEVILLKPLVASLSLNTPPTFWKFLWNLKIPP